MATDPDEIQCEFQRCDFRLKVIGGDDFAIFPDFVCDAPSVLRRGSLSFHFREDTTVEQAREVERLMSQHLAGISYQYFPGDDEG
jgi:hypothetical protein